MGIQLQGHIVFIVNILLISNVECSQGVKWVCCNQTPLCTTLKVPATSTNSLNKLRSVLSAISDDGVGN